MSLREKLSISARIIAEHIHQEEYSGIIISGTSSLVSRMLFLNGWDKLYSDSRPKIYDFEQEGNELLYTGFDRIDTMQERIPLVQEFMQSHFPELLNCKSRLLYLDDHSKQGKKIECLRNNFPEFGLQNVEFAVFVATTHLKKQKNLFAGIYNNKAAHFLYNLSESLRNG
jgi:hypothetical protein